MPLVWAIGGGIALLFPLLLLSMLVANSPLHLLSWRVWKSLLGEGLTWIAFHLTAVATGLAVAWLEIALWRRADWAIGIAVAGPVAAAAWMIYFRLTGRLAWFLSLRMGGT